MDNPFDIIEQKLKTIEELLLRIQEKNMPTIKEKDNILTIEEAAKFLSLSTATIYSLVSKSEIPVYKKSKRLYFSEKELFVWVQSGRKKTNSEISILANQYLQSQKQ